MTVGQRLRERRRELGMTLRHLADATDLSLTYLSDLERGRAQPSLKTFRRIAWGLDISTADLMYGVDGLGSVTERALPAGLRHLQNDPYWGDQLDDEWISSLLRIEYRGRRPQTKEEWLEVYLSLRRILGGTL